MAGTLLKLVVGRTYLTESGKEVEVNRHDDAIYPLKGSNGVPYTEDGFYPATYRHEDDIELVSEKIIDTGESREPLNLYDPENYFEEDAISAGDIICTDMHFHTPNNGVCKDWDITTGTPLEITEEQFHAILNSSRKESDKGHLVMNKCAYVVSTVVGVDGNITSVLAIYRYDFTYHIIHLFAPYRLQQMKDARRTT